MTQDMNRFLPIMRRKLKRRHAIDMLAGDPKHFAARRQDDGMRTLAQKRLRQLRRRVDDMLAIVENKQQPLPTDGMRDRLRTDISSTQPQFKQLGHPGRHESGIGQRRQFNKPRAIIEFTQNAAGDLQSENGLSDTARPRQSYRAMRPEKTLYLPHGCRSADQAWDGIGKIAPGGFSGYLDLLQTDRWPRRTVMPDGPVAEQARLYLRYFAIGAWCFVNCHRVYLKSVFRHDRARPTAVRQPFPANGRARSDLK